MEQPGPERYRWTARGVGLLKTVQIKAREEGRYGACTACSGPIPFERLAIFPETKCCAACAKGC